MCEDLLGSNALPHTGNAGSRTAIGAPTGRVGALAPPISAVIPVIGSTGSGPLSPRARQTGHCG
jgi:hypothetical protein